PQGVNGEKEERKSARRLWLVLKWVPLVLLLAVFVIFCILLFQLIQRPRTPVPVATVSPTPGLSIPRGATGRPAVQSEPAQSEVPVLFRNRTTLLWIGGLLPLALFAANELRRFFKQRHLVLERTRGLKPPFTWPPRIESRAPGYLNSEQ